MRTYSNSGDRKVWRLSDSRFKCHACGQYYSWTTAWDSAQLGQRSKHKLLELFVLCVLSDRHYFRRSVNTKAPERFYRPCRACSAIVEQLREPFEEALECDESTFGGARHGTRAGAPPARCSSSADQEQPQLKAMPIAPRDYRDHAAVQAHVRTGSPYYTDEWQAYATLKLRDRQVMIRKEKGRPVGCDHINGIEGF